MLPIIIIIYQMQIQTIHTCTEIAVKMPPSAADNNITQDRIVVIDYDYYEYGYNGDYYNAYFDDEVYLTSTIRGRGGRRSGIGKKEKGIVNVYSSQHARIQTERKKAMSKARNQKK